MGRIALRLLLGGLLAATVLGAVYLLVGAPPLARVTVTAAGPSHPAIARGFVGVAIFGHWRLICAAEGTPTPAAKPAASNQCRINQEVAARDQPGQVIVAANLSVVGPAKRPALMLRLPPTARDGDLILLRADNVNRARAFVRGCTASECFAAGNVADEDWHRLLAAKALQVSFPALNRQPVLVEISADGLADAARAMASAQVVAR